MANSEEKITAVRVRAKTLSDLEKFDLREVYRERLAEFNALAYQENWDLTKKILLTFLALSTIVAPGLAHIFKLFNDDPRNYDKRYRIKKTFDKLIKNKAINFIKVGENEYRATITERGTELALAYKIRYLKIKKPKRWDGKWRLLIFDIPEKFKVARDVLRDKLKQLGFYGVQKSAWVYPFPCWEEIKLATSYYNVSGFVTLVEVNQFNTETEEKLKEWFELS